MKTFEQDFKTNPSFNTVVGLFNTTFDPENYVANRGATEGQIKIVHDMIKALQDWLDEFGCSDDPYEQIKTKVEELEEAIGICCANPQDALIQALNDRLDALEQAMEECCNEGGGGTSTCDGNEITVSYSWNGPNPLADGGKATATSSIAGRNIVSFHFLAREGGVYIKTPQASGVGPDWGWTIDSSGNMRASSGTWTGRYAVAIVATDEQGCEGVIPITLPGGAVGG